MPYKLKGESFEIMGGPDEGKQFKRGSVYDVAPAGYEDRFEEIAIAGLRQTTPNPAYDADKRLTPELQAIKKKREPAPEIPATDAGESKTF